MKDLEKIITKELLRRVLPKRTENLSDSFSFTINEDYIEFSDDGEMQFEYCIYKFAFKCKEWAKGKEVIIHSSPTQKIEHTAIVQSFDFNKFYYGENQFYALTEVESIIEACEWILNQDVKSN